MLDQFFSKAGELLARDEAFAVAIVVRYQAPISGKPGNKAIIFADGRMWGWIGGGCAQPLVVKEALRALADGQPRLIRISPSSSPQEGIVDYTMTCHSGGTLDIFIEPVVPQPHILILGRSPVARTLARIGKTIGYTVSVLAPEADRESFPDADLVRGDFDLNQLKLRPQVFIVVSTQGEGDEVALEKALRSDAAYVALVASKVKADKILDYLRERGFAAERLSQVRAPAGVDIRAFTPEEIAVSILAEIIQVRRTTAQPPSTTVSSSLKPEARDPVCGMTVPVSGAKYKSEYQSNSFYFCCAGCKETFDREPDNYTVPLQL